ncbi:MAG: helix-turn-helix domain-containing protein, partial [Rhodopila sp.]
MRQSHQTAGSATQHDKPRPLRRHGRQSLGIGQFHPIDAGQRSDTGAFHQSRDIKPDRAPVSASDEQRAALTALAGSRERGEADRARAILLTLSGWTSPRIAEAFSVREDTVRLWRSDFGRGGVDALKASIAPGP